MTESKIVTLLVEHGRKAMNEAGPPLACHTSLGVLIVRIFTRRRTRSPSIFRVDAHEGKRWQRAYSTLLKSFTITTAATHRMCGRTGHRVRRSCIGVCKSTASAKKLRQWPHTFLPEISKSSSKIIIPLIYPLTSISRECFNGLGESKPKPRGKKSCIAHGRCTPNFRGFWIRRAGESAGIGVRPSWKKRNADNVT